MEYDQFLYQLRRIGKQIMMCSIVSIIVFVAIDVIIGEPLTDLDKILYFIFSAMFLIGLMIYPFKCEE